MAALLLAGSPLQWFAEQMIQQWAIVRLPWLAATLDQLVQSIEAVEHKTAAAAAAGLGRWSGTAAAC